MLQHNVLHWRERKLHLSNIYWNIDPDIILINSHGLKNNETIRIPQYRIHQKNTANTHTDGTAIAVKHTLPHKMLDTFISDTLAVEIDTTTGKIIIATLYQPPARPYIPTPDFLQLFRRNTPVYMIADLNANHQCLGYRQINNKGRQIYNLIQNHTIQHIGPHFPTYTAANTRTTPDIIITNYRTHHNAHIKPGPLTTSDHTPIILTISSSLIQIPTVKRPSFIQANWERFRTHIEDHIDTTPFPNSATLEDIDTEIESWYSTILTQYLQQPEITYQPHTTEHSLLHNTVTKQNS